MRLAEKLTVTLVTAAAFTAAPMSMRPRKLPSHDWPAGGFALLSAVLNVHVLWPSLMLLTWNAVLVLLYASATMTRVFPAVLDMVTAALVPDAPIVA